MNNRKTIRRAVGFTAALLLLATLFAPAPVLSAERLALSVDVANVRSGPGTNYEVLWKMEKYTPIEAKSTKGEWIFFEDFEGTRGWMHEDLVDDTPTVITRADLCNIRSSAGTDGKIIFRAESGVPFKVLRRQGEWINILHADGDKGWIHQSLVW